MAELQITLHMYLCAQQSSGPTLLCTGMKEEATSMDGGTGRGWRASTLG